MRNYQLDEFKDKLTLILDKKDVITKLEKIRIYSTGIRVGSGFACAVALPRSLIDLWKVLKLCIKYEKIIIMQAANTGLTGGSTPDGDDYDRDVVIISTRYLNKLILLKDGTQVLSFPGSTLYALERLLSPLGRAPHSVIGSSCIGASIVGGVCNNSGGNLINRGPAYTELALFARVDNQGNLELVNHLDIDLGDSPEEILSNLDSGNFDFTSLRSTTRLASDDSYHSIVRDFNASTPARFNSDERCLFESSGCAGKIAVFVVRLDTFPSPINKKVFYIGAKDPKSFTALRKRLLIDLQQLPEMCEYMHKSYFDGADKYCKDTFLFLKFFGTGLLPLLLYLKQRVDYFSSKLAFLPLFISDKILQFLASLLPDHIPKRIREYRSRFDHLMLIVGIDSSIEEIRKILNEETLNKDEYEFFECTESEGKDALLHRYVAGSAPVRYRILKSENTGQLLPLDIALPRNFESWHDFLPEYILNRIDKSFMMAHFICMVFHWDFVLKKGENLEETKNIILGLLDQHNAKYPAEHNVGTIYKADKQLSSFYRNLDPTNTFNSGIGKSSKKKFYK